jgi:hypothetical protein
MVAFPLLERYLRQKVGLTPNEGLSPGFYNELFKLFPKLQTQEKAKEFWQVYRNGILHQVAFSNQTSRGTPLPASSLSHAFCDISVTSAGSFFLNPADFARRVTQQIEADFTTFEGTASSAPPLATEWAVSPDMLANILNPANFPPLATVSGVNLPGGYILGTSVKPPGS